MSAILYRLQVSFHWIVVEQSGHRDWVVHNKEERLVAVLVLDNRCLLANTIQEQPENEKLQHCRTAEFVVNVLCTVKCNWNRDFVLSVKTNRKNSRRNRCN